MATWIENVHRVVPIAHVIYPLIPWSTATEEARQKRRVYDMVYIFGWVTLLYVHWVLFRECILTVWEKQAYDASYRAGECPTVKPFQKGKPPPSYQEAVFFLLPFVVLCRMELPAPLKWGTALAHAALIAYKQAIEVHNAGVPRCRALAKAVAVRQGRPG
jgi:hypothetical protein